jgi:hypothetical protein
MDPIVRSVVVEAVRSRGAVGQARIHFHYSGQPELFASSPVPLCHQLITDQRADCGVANVLPVIAPVPAPKSAPIKPPSHRDKIGAEQRAIMTPSTVLLK